MRGIFHGGWAKAATALSACVLMLATMLQLPANGASVVATVNYTVLISSNDAGSPGAAGSRSPASSNNGLFVAFISDNAFVAADTNGVEDVYRKDLANGTTQLVSINGAGVAGNGASGGEEVAISDDGNIVVFRSDATDLIASDTNGQRDLFARNMTTGVTTQVNLSSDEATSAFGPDFFSVSADGTKVAFVSYTALGGGDVVPAVYRRDLTAGTTQYINQASGAQVAISGDGNRIAFSWNSSGGYEIYMWDQNDIGTLYKIDFGTSTNNADADGLLGPDAMSNDGNIISFWSDGDAYPPGPQVAQPRAVYAYNHTVRLACTPSCPSGTTFYDITKRMSEDSAGTNANGDSGGSTNDWPKGGVSADGTKVAFNSQASNLDPDATNGGLMVKNVTTGAINAESIANDNATVVGVGDGTISPDGGYVAFTTGANGVTANDTNGQDDVFEHVVNVPAPPAAPAPANPLIRSSGTATLPGFTALAAADVPATAIPLVSLDEVSGVPLRSVDVASSPLRSVPLRSVPLRSVPLRSVPLRSVTLSELPLLTGSWTAILGTLSPNPFVGVPLQNVTLDAVLNAFDAQPSATGLNAISIGDVDLASTPLRSVAIASLLLGSTPLRSVPVPGTAGTAFGNWCQILQSLGYSCADLGLTQDSPVLAVDLAGVPLRSVPLRSVPLRSVDLSSAPLRSVPLRSVLFQNIPLGTLLLSKIDSVKRPTIVDCTAVNCATGTLASAAAANALVATATLGTLFDAVNANDLPGSLVELIQGLIDTSNYPWESLPLPGLQQFAGAGARTVSYTVDYDVTGTGPASTQVVVDLPPGFRYVAGSAENEADGVLLTPQVTNEHLVFNLSDAGGDTREILFDAYAGFDLGPAPAMLAVTIGATTVNAQDDDLSVVEDMEFSGCGTSCIALLDASFIGTGNNNFPGSAPIIAPNELVASHIGTANDVDYYRLPVPPKGTRIQIRLGNHSDNADFDVALLNTASSVPLRSVPLRSVPLRSVPLTDNGVDATQADSSLTPETLDDIPIGAAPLRSVSENRSTADEYIATVSTDEPVLVNPDTSTPQYYTIQVTAFNAGSSKQPYVLYVKEYAPPPPPSCPAPRTFVHGGEGSAGVAPSSLPANLDTLYLVNKKRMGDTFGATAAASILNELSTLNGTASLGLTGVAYPVESDSAVNSNYLAWDQDPCSPAKANAVFTSIASIVDSVRSQRPTLKNIVVIGGDDIIPMARVADYTQISNESDYVSETLLTTGANKGTPIAAAEATQNILTDDPLADIDPIPWLDHTLYVPDLAVGRLVEGPTDIIGALAQFRTSNGQLSPQSSLTTGYDFLADGSSQVDASLTGIPTASRKTLINETWAKGDELAALFPATGGSPDIASLNAHYDHHQSLPALGNSTNDLSDLVTTADIAAHPNTLSKKLIFTMGCHAGLAMPDAYADDAAKKSDWAQNYATQKAAVYLANTGFGYGDTAAVALSEQLMSEFAKRLDGSMTVGQAATFAKQAYFGQLGAYGPYDEKAMQEATFFGLPMWKVSGTPTTPTAPTLSPTADANGILSAPKTVNSTFTKKTSKGGGTYYNVAASGIAASGLQVTQYRPIVPRESVDVTPVPGSVPAGTLAHGVWVSTLTSHDEAGVPAVARPVIDLTANEPPPPAGDVSFPTTFDTLTQFNTPQGPRQHAVMLPGQFFRDASWNNAGGVARLFDTIGTDIKYANSSDWTPPQLTDLKATLDAGSLTISLLTYDNVSDNVKRVAVLVKDGSGGGTWMLHELVQDPDNSFLWKATFPMAGTQFEYLAQSMDGAGNVGITTNKGRYYTGLPAALQQNPPTPPKLITNPGKPNGTNGWYNSNVVVTLQGNVGVTYTKTVDGGASSNFDQPVTLTTDGSHTIKVIGSDSSTATLVVVIDKTLPSISGAVSRAPDHNGWYNTTAPTVNFTCSDATSGIKECGPDKTMSTDGANQTVIGTAFDFAGNTKTATISGLNIDLTAPTVVINGVVDGGDYTLGGVPTPSCTTTDATSGPDGACQGTLTGGSANGVGTFTYTAVGKDKAGNMTVKAVTFKAKYRWDGFLQPINDTAHQVDQTISVFKAGSMVPVKFQLKRADGSVVLTNSTPVFLTPVKGGATNAPLNESSYTGSPTPGSTFQLSGSTYTYNWNTTKQMAGFYWRIGVLLDDGTIQTVNIALR
jgi:hypothetical protein